MGWGRTRTATAMAFRDQLRRPLIPILLVVVPAFIVIWSVAITKPESRRIKLADVWVTTTMKALHGPEMAKFTIAFVAALVGVFIVRSALQGDRRLVVAGLRPREAVAARLAVLLAATGVAVVVAAVAIRITLDFTPRSWAAVNGALILTGLIYGGIGALVGVLLDKLAATYAILFVVAADLSVVQTPMFHASPSRYAPYLPGYGPTRVMLEGAFAPSFAAWKPLIVGLAWAALLNLTAYLVLRRALGAPAAITVDDRVVPPTPATPRRRRGLARPPARGGSLRPTDRPRPRRSGSGSSRGTPS